MTHDEAMTELSRCLAATKPGCPVTIPVQVAKALLESDIQTGGANAGSEA